MTIMMVNVFTATGFILMTPIAEQLFWKEIHGPEDIMKQAATLHMVIATEDIMAEDTELMERVLLHTEGIMVATSGAITTPTTISTTTTPTGHLNSIREIKMTPGTKY